MKFFYQAGAMGYSGEGYFWHKLLGYNFPKFPVITKTITLKRKIGIPFAVIKLGNTVWNKVSLHNMGFGEWVSEHYKENLILSIHGTDEDVQFMCLVCEELDLELKGIELNFSCPNVKTKRNKKIPTSKFPLYLKINCKQDPYKYDIDKIKRIHLNTIPKYFGGISGESAKKENWNFIKKFRNEGINVAGCSYNSLYDINYLEEHIGCEDMGIGSVIITNPKLVECLNYYK